MPPSLHFIKRNSLSILLVSLGSLLVVIFNYYTIKTTSGVRTYINAESTFAKAQKNSAIYLLAYLYDNEESTWELYKKNLDYAIGTREFRVKLLSGADENQLKQALIKGHHRVEDLDNYVWFYKNFKGQAFYNDLTELVERGNPLLTALEKLGEKVRIRIKNNQLSKNSADAYAADILEINKELTVIQYLFSDELSQISRSVEKTLFIANGLFVLIIVFGGGLYFIFIINKLNKSEENLKKSYNDLQLANLELDKFVYSVSHDLRAPITSIMGLVDLMKHDLNPDELPEYLKMIEESLQRQDDYIKKVLSYSKNKRLESKIVPVNFNELLDEILNDLRFSKKAQQIEFVKELELNAFKADKVRLRIVLSNLIANAIEHSDETKEKPIVTITSKKQKEVIIITVKDNGIGIKQEHLEKVFSMFYSGNHSQTGVGLGLYIVKDTVENMKGEIGIDSTYQKGTTITLTIPYYNGNINS